MNRVLIGWTPLAVIATTALIVGVAVGIAVAPLPSVPLIYCSATPVEHLHPCPPPAGELVVATWADGLQAIARFEHGSWVFQAPILGKRSTTTPPIAWEEL